MDLFDVRAVPGFRTVPVLYELLRAVFRRPALCAQGRVAAHRGVLRQAVVPQLVPPRLPLYLFEFPAGRRIMFGSGSALEDAFAREVRAGLTRPEQKTLPCRYFYDDVGSALFEAITCLPEYGLTRADARILKAHADDIVARLPRNVVIAELGSG